MLMNYFLIHLENFLLSIVHTCYTSFFLPMPPLPLLLLKFMNTSAFIIKHWTILCLRKFLNGTFWAYLVLLFCIWIYGWPLLEKNLIISLLDAMMDCASLKGGTLWDFCFPHLPVNFCCHFQVLSFHADSLTVTFRRYTLTEDFLVLWIL